MENTTFVNIASGLEINEENLNKIVTEAIDTGNAILADKVYHINIKGTKEQDKQFHEFMEERVKQMSHNAPDKIIGCNIFSDLENTPKFTIFKTYTGVTLHFIVEE